MIPGIDGPEPDTEPLAMSASLAKFVGIDQDAKMRPIEVFLTIWNYLRDHNIPRVTKKNERDVKIEWFVPDEKLETIFGVEEVQVRF